MGGIFALILAFVAFAVAIAMPLFAQRWKTLGIMVAGAVLFFGFVTYDLPHPDGITQVLGPFVFGLMLFALVSAGFAVRATWLLLRGDTAGLNHEFGPARPRTKWTRNCRISSHARAMP